MAVASDQPVTYANVASKTILLLLVTVFSAYVTIYQIGFNLGLIIGASILAFVSVLIGTRSVSSARIFGFIYALCEGVILGTLTALAELSYPGIAFTAVSTTLIVMLIMMILYSTNIIKVDQKFASFMVVAMISIIMMSIFMLITGLLGNVNSGLYVGVAILSTIIAALYLFMDFEHIKRSVEMGIDKQYSWNLALGLMVSLVWLYVEILRLLLIFSRRNN
jgi:uncharacterized YccA/Bax inhibitor family protein